MWVFLLLTVTYSLDCRQKNSFRIENSIYPFVLNPLPYPEDFLSTTLSSRMVQIHHDNHQNTYLKKLNTYVSKTPKYNDTKLYDLCEEIWGDSSLNKYAGGLYNHYMYWWILTKPSCTNPMPTGKLLTEIEDQWGSFGKFVAEFNFIGSKVFGNGWVWLCVNKSKEIEIRTTEFQKNPLMEIGSNVCYPFLGIDLWEHAYYLKYTYDRDSYISDFWNIVDWSMVEYFYEVFARKNKAVPL